ncbi:unnamed protein product, partial [Closterium sp. Naga37s-1]
MPRADANSMFVGTTCHHVPMPTSVFGWASARPPLTQLMSVGADSVLVGACYDLTTEAPRQKDQQRRQATPRAPSGGIRVQDLHLHAWHAVGTGVAAAQHAPHGRAVLIREHGHPRAPHALMAQSPQNHLQCAGPVQHRESERPYASAVGRHVRAPSAAATVSRTVTCMRQAGHGSALPCCSREGPS